jgi:glucosamine 6-phosphate synthetase-like amidotransferase/phosphosugar isomerase protein
MCGIVGYKGQGNASGVIVDGRRRLEYRGCDSAGVIAVSHRGDTDMARRADTVFEVAAAADRLAPLLAVIPLQFLADHLAVLARCDVDQPRNLANSVTVE